MEAIRGIQNPLQTPLVLECIFQNLAVSDLKACRQVCRAWHKEATKVMGPLTQVNIQGDKEGRGVADFLELVQSEASTFSESPFVNKFHITSLDYSEEGPALWEFCGRSMKSLHLTNVSFESGEELGHAIFQSCPNLEKLKLEAVDVNLDDDSDVGPDGWIPPRFPLNLNLKSLTFSGATLIYGLARMEILSHFPSLEELMVGYNEELYTDWIFRSLAILREHDNQGWSLKKVSFGFNDLEEPLSILPLFVERSLALETFEAGDLTTAEHSTVLRKILEANAKSLKDLTLVQYPMKDVLVMNVFTSPNNLVLEKMERLFLFYVDLPSITFLRSVPNLSRLKLYTSPPVQPGFQRDAGEDWVLTSCMELELDDEFDTEELEQLLRRLPNLEKLTILGCDNEKFAVICKLEPKLTYLSLWIHEVDDCGISGLDVKDVESINQEGANGWTWWRPITVARPNITNLKSLKWFRAVRPREGRRCSMGFSTALCGIQQLPQLQHLYLGKRSLPIIKQLMEQFPWQDKDE